MGAQIGNRIPRLTPDARDLEEIVVNSFRRSVADEACGVSMGKRTPNLTVRACPWPISVDPGLCPRLKGFRFIFGRHRFFIPRSTVTPRMGVHREAGRVKECRAVSGGRDIGQRVTEEDSDSDPDQDGVKWSWRRADAHPGLHLPCDSSSRADQTPRIPRLPSVHPGQLGAAGVHFSRL